MRLFALFGLAGLLATGAPLPAPRAGTLFVVDKDTPRGECPLKHTDVKAEISGFLARVHVTQDFENSAKDKVEAVYVFPLPHNAAVDGMKMSVGTRVIQGVIKRREEAQAMYDAARNSGRVASLLNQERPNIFTQRLANIMPGAKVRVEITYTETLEYEAGQYSFAFPMVVGPRYIPGNPIGRAGGGWAPDTDRVPDASSITPPIAAKGTRAGHDVSVQVTLDAGVPLDSVVCASHECLTQRPSASRAVVRLKDANVVPNKDFTLHYDVAGRKMEDALLTHRGAKGGFFTFLLQPPERVTTAEITPKELVFVLDTSGSMNGFPIEKAKETMRLALDGLNPQDKFNLITFAGETSILFPQPVSATAENLQSAKSFLAGRRGHGGTEMMKAVAAALTPSDSQKHVRVVCFMTDGYVGNEDEIIAEIKRHANARVFSFGIGSAVNRYLLDKMAEAGRGEVEYVSLSDDGSAAAKRFHERVRNPLLTDITIEWNGLSVADVYPPRIPDLFSAKPLAITGRYTAAAKGQLRIKGRLAGALFLRDVAVDFPATLPEHDVLPTLWARKKVDSLMHSPTSEMREAVTKLGLDFGILTSFTSFVAVEETIVTEGGQPRRVQVPVEMPEGVKEEGVFANRSAMMAAPASAQFVRGIVGGAFSKHATPTMAQEVKTEIIADNKLHPSLKGVEASKLAKDGIVRVQVYLRAADAATLEQLKRAGLQVVSQPNGVRLVVGRIEVGKLEKLAAVDAVTFISPAL